MTNGRSASDDGGALAALSGDPGTDWRSRFVHHGGRVAVVLLVALLVPILFPRSPLPRFSHLEEGTVADEDVIADISFPVQKSPDRLADERREAERSVTPIFQLRPGLADSSAFRARRLFASMDSVDRGAGTDTAALRTVAERHGVDPTAAQLVLLADSMRRAAQREALLDTFRELLPRGVAPTSQRLEVTGGRALVRGPDRDRRIDADSIITLGHYYQLAGERAPETLGAEGLQLHQTLVVGLSEPTLELDRTATEAARRQARQAVETDAGHVLEGERIVTAHERIGAAEVQKLRAYRTALRDRGMVEVEGGIVREAGAALYALLLVGLLAGVMLFFRTDVYRDMRGFLIVTSLTAVVLFGASLAADAATPAALVPVALAALVVGTLYDGLLAFAVVAVIAGLLVGQPDFAGPATPFLTLAAGAAAAFGVRGVRRRTDAWILIAAITGAYALGGLSLALMRTLPLGEALAIAGWGTANATACTLLAVGVLIPMLESVTGIITEQTLLELCDLNRPLLRRLSRDAPGTYAHTINVANLTESACSAIGADALLARAGTYYHDIGKMSHPQFFIENQPKGRNPHDRLSPRKSADVIRSHVSEGLKMAREARLPDVIQDFVREHHGTTPIAFFLEKARGECAEGVEPCAEDFCYEGPKPRSRETAVLMLADGVESTVRSLDDPSPEGIRSCVDGIVRARLESGQLDEAPLTLREVDRVKREFVRVLTGIYHHRIDYPDSEPGPPPEPTSAEDGEPPAPADGTGPGAFLPGPRARRGSRSAAGGGSTMPLEGRSEEA